MQYVPKNLFRTIRNLIEMLIRLTPSQHTRVGTWRIVLAVVALNLTLASLANAQISPNLPNPTGAPNPLTTTLSIFRSNMQDKIMKAADAMPESKYSYRPTKDVRSFGEIVTHVADISYTLCSNVKGEATPATATREQRGATSERVYVPRAGPSIIYGMPHASQRDRGPLHRNGSSYYPATTRRQRLRAI